MTTQLTASILTQISSSVSAANAAKWADPLNAAMAAYEINTELRVAAFIAQALYESAYLKSSSENLNYSASRLLVVFPSYFDATSAAQYANKPEMIGNRVYANRYGNGPESSGDGYKYRGRGLFQITFKSNYHSCSRGINLDCLGTPDNLLDVQQAANSAAWFWNNKGLNAYADRKLFDKTTRIINGGTNGAADRLALYNTALKILTGQQPDAVQPTNTDALSTQATPVAKKQDFEEPKSSAAPVYPYNNVQQTRSGHLIELDDTGGAERVNIQHRSGSYIEMGPDGTTVLKAILDFYNISAGDFYQYASGDFTARLDGQSFTKIGGDWIVKADGAGYIDVGQRLQINTPMLAVSDNITCPNASIDQLSGTYGDILVREANLAHDIGSSDGSSSGPVLNNSLQFTGAGNPQFIKPVQNTQPLGLSNSASQSELPAPSDYSNSVHTQTNPDGTKTLLFSDGTDWHAVTTTPLTNNGTGSSGGGSGA